MKANSAASRRTTAQPSILNAYVRATGEVLEVEDHNEITGRNLR
jgi:hypothetical protein